MSDNKRYYETLDNKKLQAMYKQIDWVIHKRITVPIPNMDNLSVSHVNGNDLPSRLESTTVCLSDPLIMIREIFQEVLRENEELYMRNMYLETFVKKDVCKDDPTLIRFALGKEENFKKES